jgi:DNA-binding NarL/FixJ family response regulator
MSEGITDDRQESAPTRLFLVGSDPIFLLGLQIGLEQNSALQVIGTAPDSGALWSTLATSGTPNIFILDLDSLKTMDETLVVLCRQLKNSYPHQPIWAITGPLEAELLSQLRQAGLEGYSLKGADFQSLYRSLQNLRPGESAGSAPIAAPADVSTGAVRVTVLTRLTTHLRQTSLQQIQARRQQVEQDLSSERISWWEWVVLSGQLREVNVAQLLVEQMFPSAGQSRGTSTEPNPSPKAALSQTWSPGVVRGLGDRSSPEMAPEESYRTIKSVVLDRLAARLTVSSINLTGTPLEVDLLRADRKQELFLIVLKQFEDLLDELRFSGVSRPQLFEKRSQMLRDLWQSALTDFLGKYRTITPNGPNPPNFSAPGDSIPTTAPFLEVVPALLLDAPVVEASILNHIPLFVELVDHLLSHTDLMLDQQVYPVGSLEAFLQTDALLGNGVIQIANAVVQPLVNRFSTDESIRHDFFDRRWLSTREIERFRNALSWKYRLQQWFVEPKDIFESQHRLMIFSETGIKYRAIYAPRDRELQSLSGLPFLITLALETRDAVTPPIQATVTFLGRGFIYLLTQVIGRSIGLVGQGILQGIGYARSEVRRPPHTQSAESADRRHHF